MKEFRCGKGKTREVFRALKTKVEGDHVRSMKEFIMAGDLFPFFLK